MAFMGALRQTRSTLINLALQFVRPNKPPLCQSVFCSMRSLAALLASQINSQFLSPHKKELNRNILI